MLYGKIEILVISGCGHSYHTNRLMPITNSFLKCAHAIVYEMTTPARKAMKAVYQIDQNHEMEYEGGTDLEEDDYPTGISSSTAFS